MFKCKYLCVIQARLGSSRFPNKVLETVNGISMVKRVWESSQVIEKLNYRPGEFKTVVAWPERYPDLDENNVLERVRRLVQEFRPRFVIRLTADCPLLRFMDIERAIKEFEKGKYGYYSNHIDGHDVQIFDPYNCPVKFHNEHVIADFSTQSTGLSVNTKEDLERVRKICKTKRYS
jgi:spore coat polysaccharide biosynthesis protein SpsF (cytidylyltransferase family)